MSNGLRFNSFVPTEATLVEKVFTWTMAFIIVVATLTIRAAFGALWVFLLWPYVAQIFNLVPSIDYWHSAALYLIMHVLISVNSSK